MIDEQEIGRRAIELYKARSRIKLNLPCSKREHSEDPPCYYESFGPSEWCEPCRIGNTLRKDRRAAAERLKNAIRCYVKRMEKASHEQL